MELSPFLCGIATLTFTGLALGHIHEAVKNKDDRFMVALSLLLALMFLALAAIPITALFTLTPVEMTAQEYKAYQEFQQNNTEKKTFRVNKKEYEAFKKSQTEKIGTQQ